jgi:hypothetical protein
VSRRISSRAGELSSEQLVRYVQGEMTRSESEEAERLIADSRRAQERVAELRAMMDELRRPPPWAASVDLVPAIRARAVRDEAARSGRAGRRWWAAGGVTALAAAAAIALTVRPDADVGGGDGAVASSAASQAPAMHGGLRPKGGAPADPDRWVGIQLARAAGDDFEAVMAGAPLEPGGLRVSYTNLGPQPYAFLMVFAVDASREVRWLYPAYERAGTDPAAIPIAGGVADIVLPDLIEHDFARGRLVVCGLFLRRALRVGAIEAALGGRQPRPGERLPVAESGQHCFDVEVP